MPSAEGTSDSDGSEPSLALLSALYGCTDAFSVGSVHPFLADFVGDYSATCGVKHYHRVVARYIRNGHYDSDDNIAGVRQPNRLLLIRNSYELPAGFGASNRPPLRSFSPQTWRNDP